MKKLFFLLILFSCATKNKNELSCIQIVDRNGLSETISNEERLKEYKKVDYLSSQPYKKVVRIFNKNEIGKNFTIITSYHPNGLIKNYLEVVNGRALGLFKEWHSNGNLKIEAYIVGGEADLSPSSQMHWLFDKTCQVFDENGSPISSINYKNGLLDGLSTYFYPSGKIKKIVPFHQNKIHGEVLKYREEGTLFSKKSYEEGKKEGLSKALSFDGSLIYREYYRNNLLKKGLYYFKGKKVAEIAQGFGEKAIFKNGQLFQTIQYKNGVADGEVKTFSSVGTVKNSYFIKEGKKEGEEVDFYLSDANIKKISIPWRAGMIHGTVRTWYLNGQLESQKEIYNNVKNGLLYCFDKKGTLLLEEEYEKDLLKKGSYYQGTTLVSSIINGSGTATLFDENGTFLRKVKYKGGVPQNDE